MDLGWIFGVFGRILGGTLGVIKMAANREKRCFAFFAFLPPYVGVSGSPVHLKRQILKRSIESYQKLFISCLVARYSAVLVVLCRVIENLSNIYRKFIEHLSKPYRKSIENLSNIYRKPIENLSKTCRKSIEHRSKIYRTPIEHLSTTYRKSIENL